MLAPSHASPSPPRARIREPSRFRDDDRAGLSVVSPQRGADAHLAHAHDGHRFPRTYAPSTVRARRSPRASRAPPCRTLRAIWFPMRSSSVSSGDGATDGSAALIALRISRRAASASPAAPHHQVPPITGSVCPAGRQIQWLEHRDPLDDVFHDAHDFDHGGRLSMRRYGRVTRRPRTLPPPASCRASDSLTSATGGAPLDHRW